MKSLKEYPPTPVLDQMKNVRDDSQKIGEFLDWLEEEGIRLCKFEDYPMPDNGFHPISDSYEKLLSKYFDIDQNTAESERRAILNYIREKNRV